MMSSLGGVMSCKLPFVLILLSHAHAGVIHIVNSRSTEHQQESGTVTHDFSTVMPGARNALFPSQVNNFQYFMPFWWYYLRPMLNIFAADTNLRQTLQKEYEYKLEHGESVEQELLKLDDSQGFGTITDADTDAVETQTEFNLNELSDDFETDSTHTETDGLTTSNTEGFEPTGEFGNSEIELEIGEQTGESSFPAEESESPEAFGEVENSFHSEADHLSGEVDSGESFNWEGHDQTRWQFGMTGNIVGAFSNSVMGLMPVFHEAGDFNSLPETTEGNESLSESNSPEFGESNSNFHDDFAPGTGFNAVSERNGMFSHPEEDTGDQGAVNTIHNSDFFTETTEASDI